MSSTQEPWCRERGENARYRTGEAMKRPYIFHLPNDQLVALSGYIFEGEKHKDFQLTVNEKEVLVRGIAGRFVYVGHVEQIPEYRWSAT